MDKITQEEKIQEKSPGQSSEELQTLDSAKRIQNQGSRKTAETKIGINPG